MRIGTINGTRTAAAAALAAALIAAAATLPGDALAGGKTSKAWKSLAKQLRNVARGEAKADYQLALARAGLLPESRRDDARDEAREEYEDARDAASGAYRVRLELAQDLDEEQIYSVQIDPSKFTTNITNPYFPLQVGNEWTYRGETEDGVETTVVTVLDETKVIAGVTCVVVRDIVKLDGVPVEDTLDWYAQDQDGNVWYFGEIAVNYDEDGDITDVDGSWQAGKDGALPGIVMPAAPQVGDVYRQEFYAGEAEDYARVLETDGTASVPFGSFTNCVVTFDGNPMEPDHQEHKTYASGVGTVLELDVESGERVELISFTTQP